jgi:hypothetical protein
MPRQPGLSRQGADQAGDQLTIPGGSGGGDVGGGIAGVIGTLPPTAKTAALIGQGDTATQLQDVLIQNAHLVDPNDPKSGQFVAPTPASISAAVAAGGTTPMYALTHDVPDAYPLTWVNNLYVKASGLPADKTEAIATLIRYLATDGQAAAQQWGEGTLSPALVKQALQAADKVVQSNCPAAHGTVVQNNLAGSYAPVTAGIQAIGPMLHCVPPAAAPTTSLAPTAPDLSGSGISSTSGIGQSSPSTPALPTTSATPAVPTKPTTGSTKEALPAALTASRLPIPLPGTPLDRIATVSIGALGFGALRGPVRRMLGRAVE